MNRRSALAAVLAAPLFVFARSARAQDTVAATVSVDASSAAASAPRPGTAPESATAGTLWTKWARLDSGTATAPSIAPADAATGRAAFVPGQSAAVFITNPSAEKSLRVTVATKVGRGLWRVDAAILDKDGVDARAWRMESAWRPTPGSVRKTVLLRPDQILILRLTETVSAARLALADVRRTVEGASSAASVKRRVQNALAPVGECVATMDGLIGKSDAVPMAKKTHRALLATAQAQALWKNNQDAEDQAFEDLLTALSEVSCAAYNLVPRQTTVVDAAGRTTWRVAVKNAGKRTVPLVSIGLRGEASNASSVFGQLGPGEEVAATLRPKAIATAQGVIQFILNAGSAVVAASPVP